MKTDGNSIRFTTRKNNSREAPKYLVGWFRRLAVITCEGAEFFYRNFDETEN